MKVIDLLSNKWELVVGIAVVLKYSYDRGRELWLDKKKREVVYNRVFTSVIKLYLSFIKHKMLYSEETPYNLPNELYSLIASGVDSFNSDIDEFKIAIDKESEIIPEILIQTHILIETIDRVRILDKINASVAVELGEITNQDNLFIKRALFYSFEKVLKEHFEHVIIEMRKYTTVKKSFIDNIFIYDSKEYFREAEKAQREIFKRYIESLNRQGAIPISVLDAILNEINKDS